MAVDDPVDLSEAATAGAAESVRSQEADYAVDVDEEDRSVTVSSFRGETAYWVFNSRHPKSMPFLSGGLKSKHAGSLGRIPRIRRNLQPPARRSHSQHDSLHIGIFFALLCAFATNLGFLYKHRGAWRRQGRHPAPARSGAGLFRSGGRDRHAVALGAWVFDVAALAMAPLSSSRRSSPGGLVFLAVIAERFFGFQRRPRASGWASGSPPSASRCWRSRCRSTRGAHSSYSVAAMIAFEAGLLGGRHLCS